MLFTPELLVFSVQGLVKLGLAARDAYEQYVRDRPASLPLLGEVELADWQRAAAFFREPENRIWVAPGGRHADLWDQDGDDLKHGPAAEDAIVLSWLRLRAAAPAATPFAPAQSAAMLVRQWQGEGPPPPWLRLALALTDVTLDFAQSSPTLLGPMGASQPLLRAVAALAGRTRGVLPDLDDPAAWRDGNWTQANFAQSLLVSAFRAGLATLAERPDAVVEERHLRTLLAAVIAPVRAGFDRAWDEAPAGQRLDALTAWEAVRDQWLPAMVASAVRAVAVERDAFFGRLPTSAAGTEEERTRLLAALAEAVLAEAQALGDADHLAMRDTWTDFFRAGLGVIAARPELLVTGADAGARQRALRDLVGAVARRLADAPRGVGRALLLDVATAALDSARATLPLALGDGGGGRGWDAVAAELAGRLMDGLRPALAGDGGDPVLLRRLAGREQATAMVGTVLRRVAAAPRLVTGGSAGAEAEAVVAAIAGAMARPGADLLHAEGWLAVAGAAAGAAARNPGRLFRLGDGAEAAPGAALVRAVLREAEARFAAAPARPVLAGEVLQDTLLTVLAIAERRVLGGAEVEQIGALLRHLAAEAAQDDGRLMPARIPVVLGHAAARLLDEHFALAAAVAAAMVDPPAI